VGLRQLRAGDAQLAGRLTRRGVAVLLAVLLALRAQPRAHHLQVAIVEPGEELAALHGVARAHGRLAYIALERRRDRALDLAFDARVGRHAVHAAGKSDEERERREQAGAELEARMAGTGEPRPEIA